MLQDQPIQVSWRDCIFNQRSQEANILREPFASLADKSAPEWSKIDRLNAVLLTGFNSIPYCNYLYAIDKNGLQISDTIDHNCVLTHLDH